MKPATLHSLITARSLLDEAKRLIASDERHLSTAGLIVSQDALELIFLALLLEKGVDEEKNLESKSFDELIGELRTQGIRVPRSGTLKALNKQRVLSKHYGQLVEPVAAHNYLDAALYAIQIIVPLVLRKTLEEILIAELLTECETRDFLINCGLLIQREQYFEALVEVRKAIFVEVEFEYAIDDWSEISVNDKPSGLLLMIAGGAKAPYWKRNKEWIEKNVKDSLDYIQIDYEKLRLDAMEWGVHTEELQNVRRLTPQVFRFAKDKPWHIEYGPEFIPNQANASNANYCLDRALSIVLRKHQHAATRRWPSSERPFDLPILYINTNVYSKASTTSDVVHVISEDFSYSVDRIVSGFDPSERYYNISGSKPNPEAPFGREIVDGFLLIQGEDI